MRVESRTRLCAVAWLVALVVLGLGSRRLAGAPPWVTLYVGDVAWGAFFFASFRALRPSASTLRVFLAALITTELIELSQLYHAPALDALRATRFGGLLLGRVFLWSDVFSVALGASLGAGVERALARVFPSATHGQFQDP
jgi:hypothetical protein